MQPDDLDLFMEDEEFSEDEEIYDETFSAADDTADDADYGDAESFFGSDDVDEDAELGDISQDMVDDTSIQENSSDAVSLSEPENEESEEDEPDPDLMAQYDKSFTGEEQIDQMLSGIMGKFSTHMAVIPVDSIVLPKVKKEMRAQTIIGLTGLVSTLSDVVTPIHVMTMEEDDIYTLLDGSRRLYSAIKCGKETINAVVWDFDDKSLGRSISNILGLVLNRSQKLKNSELWAMLRVLETVNKCTPGRIEFLLQMEAGDAMRLKDVMLAEGDEEVAEVKEKFLSGELTIDAAYKKIAKIRKTENRLERDEERELDLRSEEEVDAGKTAPGHDGSVRHLSNDEVKNILEMGAEDVSDQTLEALREKGEKMREDAAKPHVQKVGERHPVDPEIRQKTFERDGYKCRCCGIGDELYLSILVFHHAVPVFADGPDTVENGLTLCANCHLMLHNYVDGHLHGDISEYTPEEQKTLRNIFKYGNIALRAAQAKGLKKGDIHELDADSRQHIMPNTFVKANNEAFYATQEHNHDKDDDDEITIPTDYDSDDETTAETSDFDRGLEEDDDE